MFPSLAGISPGSEVMIAFSIAASVLLSRADPQQARVHDLIDAS